MRLENKNPQGKADFLFTVEGVPGYWATMSGIKKNYTRGKYPDALAAQMRPLSSATVEYDDVTISRTYDNTNSEDIAAWEWANSQKCGQPFSCTITPVKRCGDIEAVGNAFYFAGARVISIDIFSGMDVSAGQDAAMLSVTFAFDNVERA